MIPVRVAGTDSFGPGKAYPTAWLAGRVNPPRDAVDVEAKTGIAQRYFVEGLGSAPELGAQSLRRSLAAANLDATDLGRIIFVSSVGQQMLFPATANLVAAELGLRGSCDCFDLNNACMGFLSAFDIAARAIATGGGPVAVVVVEFGSRYISPDDPRPYLVFGDAATSAVFTPARDGEGILSVFLRNDGVAFGNVILDHPGITGRKETIRFTATNATMSGEAIDAIRTSVDAVLDDSRLSLADVDWILPHQPNGALLRAIVETLDVSPERVVPVVQDFGSVGSASIPISLDRLYQSGRVRAGDRILLVGVGAGLSYGAILYQEGGR